MGRLPTSGYCLTCRRRRVKCDRSRPACQRCLKSGHHCNGYEEIHFRMDKLCLGAPQQTLPIPRGPALLKATLRGRTRPVGAAVSSANVSSNIDTYLDHFLSTYHWAHWWKYILYSGLQTETSSASYKTAESLLTGYFAAKHADNELLAKSRRLYGESLGLVSHALTFQTRESFVLLALPIMILSMHPYVLDQSAELEHHIGLGVVMMHCGPSSFQRPGLVGIFRSCRAMLVCQAFAKRRRTFLEEAHWKSIPIIGKTRTFMDRLYDIFSHIPGLFEDAYLSSSGCSDNSRVLLTEKFETLTQQLHVWRTAWDAESSSPLAPTDLPATRNPKPSDTSTDRAPFKGSGEKAHTQFDSLDRALESITYSAAIICLQRLSGILTPRNHVRSEASDASDDTALLLASTAAEMVQHCAYIACEIKQNQPPYFLAVAPVGIAYCALKDMGGPGETLARSLANICHINGFLAELAVFNIWSRNTSNVEVLR
ncbi:hypothetical protein B0I35DRAFT_276349 [Stachybotrys elegans]|uniref:Zn(2)-C6 fungal-type domain-containing protein n=1 Tax=Stachybotrys elegans TaxID=80388 RepID=A0A8K0WQD7_9HYPO|nr:hypothetical protein B0I35DRAFT_276349 [Stachybotrys elegans]